MKRVTNACVGGRNFTLNDDAYNRLDAYLRNFKAKLTVPEAQKAEVMDDIESRISELFYQEVGESSRVVTLEMVEKVVSTLGMPDGSAETGYTYTQAFPEDKVPKKLYRDVDNKGVAGVCAGLAWYFDIDVTIIRIIMLVAPARGHLRILDLRGAVDRHPQGAHAGPAVRDARHPRHGGEHGPFRPQQCKRRI